MSRAQEGHDGGRSGASGREARCVWMLAGVLSYRLCNRAFECDRCPLDRALREEALAARGSSKRLNGGRADVTG